MCPWDCGKIRGPGNLFGRSQRMMQIMEESDLNSYPCMLSPKICKALSQMIDFMISLPNQISAASICSCSLKLVGVAIHKRLIQQINSISFTAFSSRVCQLQFSLCTMCFECICILCCNFTSRTMDPQDSRMEHERATETRATGLHLGNSAANVFDLERL